MKITVVVLGLFLIPLSGFSQYKSPKERYENDGAYQSRMNTLRHVCYETSKVKIDELIQAAAVVDGAKDCEAGKKCFKYYGESYRGGPCAAAITEAELPSDRDEFMLAACVRESFCEPFYDYTNIEVHPFYAAVIEISGNSQRMMLTDEEKKEKQKYLYKMCAGDYKGLPVPFSKYFNARLDLGLISYKTKLSNGVEVSEFQLNTCERYTEKRSSDSPVCPNPVLCDASNWPK